MLNNMKIEIYNEEGILVSTDMEQILELLELNDYKVIREEEKSNEQK